MVRFGTPEEGGGETPIRTGLCYVQTGDFRQGFRNPSDPTGSQIIPFQDGHMGCFGPDGPWYRCPGDDEPFQLDRLDLGSGSKRKSHQSEA
jgi:hypothetical protein